jgi:predicted ribosome quality control (RQC) complex YloA/Tae2 family protein
LLPDYISISDHSYLNENSLKIIYGLLLVEFEARSKKCKDTMSHSSSSENLSKEESVSILKGKISLFPGVLRQKMVRPLPEFLKKLESRLSTSKTAMEIKKKLSKDEEELQSILKQLRKAKINRYQLNLHVQNLIGRYLMLKRKYPS